MTPRHSRRIVTFARSRDLILLLLGIALIINETIRAGGPRLEILAAGLLCAGFPLTLITDWVRTLGGRQGTTP